MVAKASCRTAASAHAPAGSLRGQTARLLSIHGSCARAFISPLRSFTPSRFAGLDPGGGLVFDGGGSVAGPVLVWCHDKAWPRVTMERCVESKGGCE
jgi:hypothetical protein